MKQEEAEAKTQENGQQGELRDDPAAGGPQPAESAPVAPLQDELNKARAAVADQYDKFLRLQAEFENYKRRVMREQAEQLKYAQMPLLRDLTGVMDNLERALQHGKGGKADLAAVVAGVDLVAKELADTFERHGMARFQSASQPFDPVRHQAVGVVETHALPENHVAEEHRAGYVLHDRVVRPAMVSVSKKPSGNGVTAEPADG